MTREDEQLKDRSGPGRACCDLMTEAISDEVIIYDGKHWHVYQDEKLALSGGSEFESSTRVLGEIRFCPWCGTKLERTCAYPYGIPNQVCRFPCQPGSTYCRRHHLVKLCEWHAINLNPRS